MPLIDKDDKEAEAIKLSLQDLGELMGEIGFDKSFKDLTEEQALAIVERCIESFQKHMIVMTDDA